MCVHVHECVCVCAFVERYKRTMKKGILHISYKFDSLTNVKCQQNKIEILSHGEIRKINELSKKKCKVPSIS